MKDEKPIYILDATSIIHFSKISKLRLVLDVCEAYISREVYRETVERGKRYPDSVIIRDAVDHGTLKVYDVGDRRLVEALLRHPEIHLGEAETLAATRELSGLAIIDEQQARAIAKTYGIKTENGTLFLLFKLLALEKIDAAGCGMMLDELVSSGLYLDPLTLLQAKRKLRERATM